MNKRIGWVILRGVGTAEIVWIHYNNKVYARDTDAEEAIKRIPDDFLQIYKHKVVEISYFEEL